MKRSNCYWIVKNIDNSFTSLNTAVTKVRLQLLSYIGKCIKLVKRYKL